MKKFLKFALKWTIYGAIILVMLTYATRGPSKSKFDNAWNNMKYSITRLTGHEFKPSVPKVATVRQPRGPNGETPDGPTKVVTEEILEPGKWFTMILKDGRGGYSQMRVAWKSGPIYCRYLNYKGEVMVTSLSVGETFADTKVMKVDNDTLQPLEKSFRDGGYIAGAAAVQFMPANGMIPVKVKLDID